MTNYDGEVNLTYPTREFSVKTVRYVNNEIVGDFNLVYQQIWLICLKEAKHSQLFQHIGETNTCNILSDCFRVMSYLYFQ